MKSPGGCLASGIWSSPTPCWWPSGGGLVEPEASDLFRARLASLPISCYNDTAQERPSRMVALARSHGLSSYDATYLELAQSLGARLASFDRRLNQAAAAVGVALVQ